MCHATFVKTRLCTFQFCLLCINLWLWIICCCLLFWFHFWDYFVSAASTSIDATPSTLVSSINDSINPKLKSTTQYPHEGMAQSVHRLFFLCFLSRMSSTLLSFVKCFRLNLSIYAFIFHKSFRFCTGGFLSDFFLIFTFCLRTPWGLLPWKRSLNRRGIKSRICVFIFR